MDKPWIIKKGMEPPYVDMILRLIYDSLTNMAYLGILVKIPQQQL